MRDYAYPESRYFSSVFRFIVCSLNPHVDSLVFLCCFVLLVTPGASLITTSAKEETPQCELVYVCYQLAGLSSVVVRSSYCIRAETTCMKHILARHSQ